MELACSSQTIPSLKRRRNQARESPDSDTEVVALSAETLMATNRFLCEYCGKAFPRDQNLQLHLRQHNLPWQKLSQDQPFPNTGADLYSPCHNNISNTCSNIVTISDSFTGVATTITTTSPKKRVYICPEETCVHHHRSRALGDLTGIKKHFSRKHGERKWKCGKCSKSYAVQSDWKAHTKICGNREFLCDFCGSSFPRKDKFTKHTDYCKALAEEKAKVELISGGKIGHGPTVVPSSPPRPTVHQVGSGMNSPNSDSSSSVSVDGLRHSIGSSTCSTTSTEQQMLAAPKMHMYLSPASGSAFQQMNSLLEDQTISDPENIGGSLKTSSENDIESASSCTLSLWFTANVNTLEETTNNTNVAPWLTSGSVSNDQAILKERELIAYNHHFGDMHHNGLQSQYDKDIQYGLQIQNDKGYDSLFLRSRDGLHLHDPVPNHLAAAANYGYQILGGAVASYDPATATDNVKFTNGNTPFLSMPCLLYGSPAKHHESKENVTRDFLGVGS